MEMISAEAIWDGAWISSGFDLQEAGGVQMSSGVEKMSSAMAWKSIDQQRQRRSKNRRGKDSSRSDMASI